MNTVIKRAWNKNKLVKVEDLTGMTFQAESGGHTFEISGVDDTGAAVSLSGTVEGRFLRADNAEIIISGTASGGNVSVTLSAACYAIPGRFLLTIYVTSGGQKVAVYAAIGSVVATSGTAGGSIPPLVTDSIIAGDVTVNGVLDVTNRRAYANCSAGWYRIFKYSAGDSGDMIGGQALVVDFNVQRATGAENHSITYRGVSGGTGAFVNESSRSNSHYIKKIRYAYNSTLLEAYVDIYLSNSTSCSVGVDINVHGAFDSQQSRAVIQNLVPVAASPSGETVLTEYSFAANIPDASTGYTYMPDGTLIQWGQDGAYAAGTTKDTEVTFPKSFVDLNYAVSCITRLSGTDYTNYDGITYCIHRESVSKCTVHQKVAVAGPSGTIVREFSWIAIGRWK